MADLKIDYDLLTTSRKSLGDIYQAYDRLKSRSSHTESDWGSGDISAAMGSFSGDWDNHREKIMKSVDSVKCMADEALAGFQDTEGKLAGSLHQTTVAGTERAR